MLRDSLGVPLEPEAEQHIAIDWKGSTVYEGDYVYFTPDDEDEPIQEDEAPKEPVQADLNDYFKEVEADD